RPVRPGPGPIEVTPTNPPARPLVIDVSPPGPVVPPPIPVGPGRRLISPGKQIHILDGDATGGGHRPGTGISRKSEFPVGWSDDQILDAIADVATDPASPTRPGRGGRTIVNGTRNGVDIEVIIGNPREGGGIITGYPTNQPRNP